MTTALGDQAIKHLGAPRMLTAVGATLIVGAVIVTVNREGRASRASPLNELGTG